MSTPCDTARIALGAYALGTLEPADESLVEAHLASCPGCLTELAELESVVPALASLSADDLAPPAPPAELFARIASAVNTSDASESVGPTSEPVDLSAKRRPLSKHWLLATAASVAILAGGVTATGIAGSSSQPGTTVATATSAGVHLHVAATDTKSGTRLQLTTTGLPRNEHCHLVAVAADGSRHDAGSWDATYEGLAQITESTNVPRSQLRRLTLYGNNGKQLITITL